jgi:hypothetical protein
MAAAAESMLLEAPAVRLPPEQAMSFASLSEDSVNGGMPYLIRGVVLNEGTGRFSIYFDATSVLVSHDSLGGQAVPMRRRAVVAVLPDAPTEVFVTCGMAE